MTREKSLALLITLAAALAAAESPPGRCHSPKTVGPCRASFHRWRYNATSQMCQEFIFGGCKGNANNFVSKQDCFQTCIRGGAAEATVVPSGPATEVATPRAGHLPEAYENRPGFREFCAAPRVVGPCRASFLRWYFDLESRMCKMFIYGGCRGNKNNYLFEEHCWSQCTGDGEITEEPGDAGAQPPLPSEPFSFSTRAVVLAVLPAILVTILLGSMGVFFVKICRKNPELSVGTVWSTLDDKEYLMSNAYTL
uniref:Putative Kunitz-type serine protease inhibitor n=1 Tax=Austrelaps labialis TaxID=471292 RepID=VKT_AUSLA|nr:RecName: Full=Putative Kunitz-type serine protease inhibitor; Flags: Precursor [Austrelaps labialis]ABW90603.1 putative Kunitz-type proteinase inhibitor [Austrelaps labialis]